MSVNLRERLLDAFRRGNATDFTEALSEVRSLESLLTRVNELLSDNYPCYDKDGCKNCSGDADEIDYKSCVGYNALTMLRVGR